MRIQLSKSARWGSLLVALSIVGFLVVLMGSRIASEFLDHGCPPSSSNLRSQLQTIRSRIELYNVQNPANWYDAATPLATTRQSSPFFTPCSDFARKSQGMMNTNGSISGIEISHSQRSPHASCCRAPRVHLEQGHAREVGG